MFEQVQAQFSKAEIYPLQKGARLCKIQNATAQEYQELCQSILSNGYQVFDRWQDHGSHFHTYQKEENVLYLTYHEKNNRLRLIADQADSLPPQRKEDEGRALCPPLLTQGRPMYYAVDCGMLYVLRLQDGRFLVIDGGMCEYEEAEHFLDLLEQQNIKEGKPQIAAWFITHPHDDHFNLFARILTQYKERVQLESLVYSWAEEEYARRGSSDLTDFNKAIADFDDSVRVIQPHTGQRFMYEGLCIDILYTHEDACPEYLANVNDTSLVMRMNFAAQPQVGPRRAMFFGDAMFGTAEHLCDQYADETLQCDLMQVAHHGYSGGSDRLYRTVDPAVILWPCPDYWFQTMQYLDCNYYLTHSEKAEALFIGGRHEVTLDMSQPIRPIDPYEKQNRAQSGDVLYEENFTADRVYDLYWSAINTGRTDYVSAPITLQPGNCRLVAGEHHSMGELMQPGMLRNAPNWTLTLRGHANQVGMAALFWNYADPSIYNDEEALRLPLESGQDFDVELQVKGDEGVALLKNKGELRKELTFTPAHRRGLYLILKDADVTLHQIKVVKN